MKIDKELIEKYHRNECSAEESDAVEAWLFSVDSDLSLQLPPNESKATHKAEMWAEISTILPKSIAVPAAGTTPLSTHEPQDPVIKTIADDTFQSGKQVSLSDKEVLTSDKQVPLFRKQAFWSGAIAASLVLAILGVIGYQFVNTDPLQARLVDVNNTSFENVRHLESNGYRISVGTNTSARIDNLTGVVDLSGSMLICPKKDIELSFEGSAEKITFKKGQTYILLKDKDGKDKILIVSRQNLMDLPPVLQKQIIHEFNI